ncbi:helix-turn-helix domain-containing protein [Streptomyces sp. TRM 70351]|nr:helix-turn-helix domain-containing protein [Streptomyces sp. TRM 70351]MEE1929768.1 helix-turn-helix domain-containing protein [Streptomyces sp. TRM 70351]
MQTIHGTQDSHAAQGATAVVPVGDVSDEGSGAGIGTEDSGPARPGGAGTGGAGLAGGPAGRATPLRVDAQRNLEHVLRAAREVFGELGYGAPMEDVARRARVGVGTVYRRFPSKDVLVKRIAQEETARLTEQARTALRQEDEPWSALERFLRTSVESGAGRLLPPEILRADGGPGEAEADGTAGADVDAGLRRVPQQRRPGQALAEVAEPAGFADAAGGAAGGVAAGAPELRLVGGDAASGEVIPEGGASGELLTVVGQLVGRAGRAGELRADVTVADVLLVIATAAPSLPDAKQQEQASQRLLEILLEGLRSRPGV